MCLVTQASWFSECCVSSLRIPAPCLRFADRIFFVCWSVASLLPAGCLSCALRSTYDGISVVVCSIARFAADVFRLLSVGVPTTYWLFCCAFRLLSNHIPIIVRLPSDCHPCVSHLLSCCDPVGCRLLPVRLVVDRQWFSGLFEVAAVLLSGPLAVRLISASVVGRLPSVCVWVLLSRGSRWHFGDCQLTTRVLLSYTSVGSECLQSVVRLLAACFPLPLRLLLGCVPVASRLRFDCIQFSVHCCFCLLSVRVSQSLTLRC